MGLALLGDAEARAWVFSEEGTTDFPCSCVGQREIPLDEHFGLRFQKRLVILGAQHGFDLYKVRPL